MTKPRPGARPKAHSNAYVAKRDDVLRYITWHNMVFGYPPTIRAIQHAIGMRSAATVHKLIAGLEYNKLVTRDPRRRTLKVNYARLPHLCPHDWRTWDNLEGEIQLICVLGCGRVTTVEFHPDPDDPGTWLRYVPGTPSH